MSFSSLSPPKYFLKVIFIYNIVNKYRFCIFSINVCTSRFALSCFDKFYLGGIFFVVISKVHKATWNHLKCLQTKAIQKRIKRPMKFKVWCITALRTPPPPYNHRAFWRNGTKRPYDTEDWQLSPTDQQSIDGLNYKERNVIFRD